MKQSPKKVSRRWFILKVGVLISGRGSNLQALIDACATPNFPAKIVGVISNKADAYGLERAKKANIPTAVIPHKNYNSREEFDRQVPLSPKDYRAKKETALNEMRAAAGIDTVQVFEREQDIRQLQSAAGI